MVDLPADYEGRVAVSIIYRSPAEGLVQEWDGNAYRTLAPLPASIDENGAMRWMRTSFELEPAIRFDYQAPVPGMNVLLQFTTAAVVHRIEATPLE